MSQITRPGDTLSRDERPAAFEELAVPLFDSLYNFAHWLTQNREEAEDLVQDTYIKALRGFKSFQPGTNFRAWIFRILRNTFLSSRSKLERRMTESLTSDEDDPFEPVAHRETAEAVLIQRCDIEAVQHAMEQLPAHFREMLLLCDVEDMSYREVAEVLSIPIGTVMSRLARARKALRQGLSNRVGTSKLRASGTPERAQGA